MDKPEAKQFMSSIIKDAKQQGWEYIKIDFTYALSTLREQYNKKKTNFESLKDLYSLFREAAGEKIKLNACIGEPGRYALGKVDVTRLGGDIGSNWGTIKGNLRALFMALPTNGVWWLGDPDVFYMRKENSSLTEEENYLLTGSTGLMGGAFLTSDFPSQWDAKSKQTVEEFWNTKSPEIPLHQYIYYSDDGSPIAFLTCSKDGNKIKNRVGIYNWSDQPVDISVDIKELGLNENIKWQIKDFSKVFNARALLEKNIIKIKQQPPHSIRIVELFEN